MTAPGTSPPLIPDVAELRRVLSAIRYDQPLGDSPLVDADAVWDVLLRDGVAPGARGRAWALGVLIHETVTAQLEEARRAAGVPPPSETTSSDELAADFAANSPELELWSALYYRYLDSGQLQAGEIAARAGLPRRTLGRRLAAAQRRLAQSLAARDREARRRLAERSDVPLVDPIAGRRVPQSAGPLRTHEALLQAVRGTGQDRVPIAPDDLERLAAEQPSDLTAYRLSRLAAWSRPAYQVDARFVHLTLLVDRGEEARQRWQVASETYDDLGTVLAAVANQALVLLGPPGSGKSTLLRRFELETAVAGLRDETVSLPFFVSLGRFWSEGTGTDLPAPKDWLAGLWGRRYSDLPPFAQLLDERRMVLLIDGLNEMPHTSFDDYRTRILAWKHFLRETVADRPGLRVVFACRSLDYGAPLSSPELRVPQVRVEPMTDSQVRAFLQCYAPAQADALWESLHDTPQLELVRSPYLLALLIEQAIASGEAPIGRAALFTSFVRRALQREIERDNPLFQPGTLLDERDYRRVLSSRQWAAPWSLPERGALVPGLTQLAYGMQAKFTDGQASQARVGFDTALDLIDHAAAEDILRAGEALAVLDEHRGRDEVLFFHQLLQEYFAARHLAADPAEAAAACRTELRSTAVLPSLASVIADLELTEPLPPLPATGWEEIVLLAASMSDLPAAFIETIAAVNLPLAGRAAAQLELAERLPAPLVTALRDELMVLGSDDDIDLRARIEAGLALGQLGDPRFETGIGPDGPYLRPPMVEVPAGEYLLGFDADPDLGAAPQHRVRLAAFDIGRFPVTNSEWSRFMAAGGYDDDRWWEGDDAKAWRQGELTAEGSRRWVREWLEKMRDDPSLLEGYVEQGMSPEQVAMWHRRLAMSEEELRDYLAWKYPQRKYTAPYIGERALHASAQQPVSGICWYEARAYCRWLSEQTGEHYRLPTEAEWEAAARGGDDRPYPWGHHFDAAVCNTQEMHLRRAAPVGVLPQGRAPCGAEMLSGDVWEWTSSLWGPEVDRSTFPYPYDAADGRERLDAPPTIRRVQRGGSFIDTAAEARVFVRNPLPPDTRFHAFGMRLVRSPGER
jgi:formylglycine-generating enzyme required for sulfatase activity